MKIHSYTTPYLSSITYVLEESGHCILIDPCQLPAVEALILSKKLHVDMVLLTHEHVDHIMGVAWCQKTFGPVVSCSAICAQRIQSPRKNHSYYFELTKSLMTGLNQDQNVVVLPFSVQADIPFDGEKNLCWRGHQIICHPTPGHSPGGISILLDNHFLFTGDTLMDSEKSVTAFVDGSMEAMQRESLPWFQSLDRDIWVYPGHFGGFRLGEHLDKGVF